VSTRFAAREYHAVEAEGLRFLYLVPSAAVFCADAAASAVLDRLQVGPDTLDGLEGALAGRFAATDVRAALSDLMEVRAVGPEGAGPEPMPVEAPPEGIPLKTMVLNVTSKCNLGCTYCYEYGDDRVVEAGTMPRFMDEATARQSVDFMLGEAGVGERCHLTFFGGETLLNFKLLQSTLTYAKDRAAEEGKRVDFSLTTNGTLLKPEIIEWLAASDVGVTISIDGPREVQDKLRVFNNGKGSYDEVVPKVRELLKRHTSRPVGARVTLTKANLDIIGTFRHLTEDIGFFEVGFAPVTTAEGRDYAIEGDAYWHMLAQFEELAWEWLEHAVQGRHHGFSNVGETIEEIHKGFSKSHPCGAGVGMMGVSTDGNLGLCHRFAGSEEHRFGNVTDGVDREKQVKFMEEHHVAYKPDCHSCWARPLCAGGCYHEAHTRYGTTNAPNLHYCDWIRSWTDTCLRVYAALAVRNPDYLKHFEH